MDNTWTILIVILLSDPHFLEGAETGKNAATDPYGVFPLGRGYDFDVDGVGCALLDLAPEPVGEPLVHGGAPAEHDVAVELLPDVDVALHDAVEGEVVDALRLHAVELGAEQELGRAELLLEQVDRLPVRQLVHRRVLLLLRVVPRYLLLVVLGHVAVRLLNVPHYLELGRGGEPVPRVLEQRLQVLGHVPARQVQSLDGVRDRIPLVDRHYVRDAVPRVQHEPRGPPAGVQGEDGLDGDVEALHAEGLEHYLRHLLPVLPRVLRGLRHQHRVLLGVHAQLVVEGVVPNLLHVLPVVHDAVLDRVLQLQDAPLCLRLVPHVGVLLAHSHHHSAEFWLPRYAGEHRSWSVVPRKSRLAHS